MSDLIGKYTNRLEDTGDPRKKIISQAVAILPHEREQLEARKASLLASLDPTPEATRRALVALLGAFPSYGEDEATARHVVAACCRACDRVPAWAVEEACRHFLTGNVTVQWNMASRPTPPQILAEAMHCTLPTEGELYRITALLEAEVVHRETTDRERHDALDAWAKLKSEMRASNVISSRTEEEISLECAAMARANERFRPEYEAEKARRAQADEEGRAA